MEKRDHILDIMIQTILLLLLNIVMKRVGTRVSYVGFFWSGDNLVKFKNIRNIFGCLNIMSSSTSVILKLLVSSHRSLGISKNIF